MVSILIGILLIGFVSFIVSYRFYLNFLSLKKQFLKSENDFTQEQRRSQVLEAEITTLKQELTAQTQFDVLTGLPNRQLIEDRLTQTVNQSNRYHLMFAVMFLCIDEFRVINDVLGHDVGDDLLRELVKRLQASIRQVDTLGRFSENCFVCVLTQLSKTETIIYIARRLLQVVSQPFKVQGQDLFITASTGIAVYPTDGQESKVLLKNADNALHRAREQGHNTHQFYQQEMHVKSQRELMLGSCLRNPAVYKEFSLHYSPEVQIETGKIRGIEVALHWQPADFGLINAVEFSRLVDQSDKGLEIGEWLLTAVLKQFSLWKKMSSSLETISVPLSLRQLSSSHFVYKISQMLQEFLLDPKNLVIEISEEALLAGVDRVEKTLNMLKHLGVQISVIYFGNRQLLLQPLKQLSIDYLKIDSLLVADIILSNEKADFVKMIILMAAHLGITAIAEGVENENQKKLLHEMGCTLMQGPLFGSFLLDQQVAAKLESTME